MCGIVGYIGPLQAAPILIDGLKRLEYRGYDSAGVAVYNEGEVKIVKSVGKIASLEEKLDGYRAVPGTLGIGHTRWATHGKPTEANSHPHDSRRFVLVHNGTIENYVYLKEEYLDGVTFKSETDTEVIPNLIEKFVSSGEGVEDAVRHAMRVIDGSYALAIIDRENPNVLYAARNKSPLLIGKGHGFNMVGSDVMAMLAQTNEFYEIKDREFAVLTADNVDIYTINGAKLMRAPFVSTLSLDSIEMGDNSHYMIKEIEEQPGVLRAIAEKYSDNRGGIKVDPAIVEALKDCDHIYIIACGTSYHSGLLGKQFFERIAKKYTDTFIASEFVYNPPLLSENPLFIFISQSGETADSRAVLTMAKTQGYKTLTITNVEGSTLSREADHTLLLHAGPEIAVASTKAYTAQLAVLAIAATALSGSDGRHLAEEFLNIADIIEEMCKNSELYSAMAKKYLATSRNCFYIGRSLDYYTCLEASLKLKEISYIQTEGFAAGELKHGTIALIEKNTPVIAIITQENVSNNTRTGMEEVRSRGANVLTIAAKSLAREGDEIIIPDVDPLLMPMVAIVAAQYIAYFAALQRGYDIDKPRNLAKSVTVE